METKDLIATAQITIEASVDKVWNALVDPEMIKQYMFGTTVTSDWKEGSKIVWKGTWEGKSYEDKGEILQFEPPAKLAYSHFSPLTGQPDIPENYHIVTIELSDKGKQTGVSLSQSNNPTAQAKAHAEKNWSAMLAGLKKLLEENGR